MLFFLRGAEFLIPTAISFVIILIIAFAYHEFAHAVVADRLGDPTPRAHGRMTLNPIPHLDRTGLFLALLIGFGWALTPVNPNYMRGNPRRAMALVAVAGPLANLLMATLFGLPILLGLVPVTPPGSILPSLYSFLTFGVYFNLLLFALNLLPIPPLDGFSVLQGILPAEMAYRLEPLRQYSMLLFIGLFFILPAIGISLPFTVIREVIGFFYPILLGGFMPLFV